MKRGWCLKYIYDDDDDDDYDDYDDDYDDDGDGDDWIWAKRACFNDRSVRFTWLLRALPLFGFPSGPWENCEGCDFDENWTLIDR